MGCFFCFNNLLMRKFSLFSFSLLPAPIYVLPVPPFVGRSLRSLALEMPDLLKDTVELVLVKMLRRDIGQHVLGRNIMVSRDTVTLDELPKKEEPKGHVLRP